MGDKGGVQHAHRDRQHQHCHRGEDEVGQHHRWLGGDVGHRRDVVGDAGREGAAGAVDARRRHPERFGDAAVNQPHQIEEVDVGGVIVELLVLDHEDGAAAHAEHHLPGRRGPLVPDGVRDGATRRGRLQIHRVGDGSITDTGGVDHLWFRHVGIETDVERQGIQHLVGVGEEGCEGRLLDPVERGDQHDLDQLVTVFAGGHLEDLELGLLEAVGESFTQLAERTDACQFVFGNDSKAAGEVSNSERHPGKVRRIVCGPDGCREHPGGQGRRHCDGAQRVEHRDHLPGGTPASPFIVLPGPLIT